MLIVPSRVAFQMWTIDAHERGVTGVRAAVVLQELLSSGKLTADEFERSWAQDPYDASYRGVDNSVLRHMSDDPGYDARFPDHPLTKVRRTLAELPNAVRIVPRTAKA